jgi:hypothetical protein
MPIYQSISWNGIEVFLSFGIFFTIAIFVVQLTHRGFVSELSCSQVYHVLASKCIEMHKMIMVDICAYPLTDFHSLK